MIAQNWQPNATYSGGQNMAYASADLGDTWQALPTEVMNFLRINEGQKFQRGCEEAIWLNSQKWNQRRSFPPSAYETAITTIIGEGTLYGIAKPVVRGLMNSCPRNQPMELVISQDDGASWQVMPTTLPIQELMFIDCQGSIYSYFKDDNRLVLLRSKDAGENWHELTGIDATQSLTPYGCQVGADGKLYIAAGQTIYRSTEVVCCAEGEPMAETSPCPIDMPSLIPVNKDVTYIAANTAGKLSTKVYVKKGDYVCVVAKGNASMTFNGFKYPTIPIGKSNFMNKEKSNPNFNIGQLLIHQGGTAYGCDEFTLKGDDCESIMLDETFMKKQFSGEYGDYFIAETDGFIELEINHNNPENNTGQFDVEIYTLTAKQHQYRNCFNYCSIKIPQEIGDNLYTDSENNKWTEKSTYKGIILDDKNIEECYHGGHEDFRAKTISSLIKGSQCVYNRNTKELENKFNDFSIGTFDYGYYTNEEDRKLHFILDVFSHIIFRKNKKNFYYAPTPDAHLY